MSPACETEESCFKGHVKVWWSGDTRLRWRSGEGFEKERRFVWRFRRNDRLVRRTRCGI